MYIFGSGINLATIQEGALKLSEAAQLVAVPLQLEEGMHGPWVTMNRGDLVIVLNFGENNRAKCEKLLESLSYIGVDLLNITDGVSSPAHEKYRIHIPVPELFTAFYSVLPLYQLTYFTALNNGKNPDFMRLWEENYLKTRLSLPR
jgi:glucosamine 6-phosphate synthetase-like amidotransferase/phosphosugar isomerase protein